MKYKIFIFLLLPTLLIADVVWPALYLETRLFSWWAILFGLIIEYFFIKRVFNLELKYTLKIVTIANMVSAILGIFLIPLSGIIWEIFPGSIFNYLFNFGTFNPITWFGTLLLASLLNTIVEGIIYKKLFKIELYWKSRKFLYLFLINILSVSLAFISIWIYPVHM